MITQYEADYYSLKGRNVENYKTYKYKKRVVCVERKK